MTASSDLRTITAALRRACLTRWTNDDIMNHVAVQLPAPIFDRLSSEMQLEFALTAPQVNAVDPRKACEEMTFDGIKFVRVDGAYWSVSARDERI